MLEYKNDENKELNSSIIQFKNQGHKSKTLKNDNTDKSKLIM